MQSAKGVITYANKAACEMMGLAYEELTGRTSHDPMWRAVKEDNSPMLGDEHPAMVVLRTGVPQRNVVMGLYYGPHGAQRWIQVNAEPIYDLVTGEPREVLTTLTDITDRKRAEESLKRRTEQLEALVRTSLAINTVLDKDSVLRTLVACARELVDTSAGTAGLIVDGRVVYTQYDLEGENVPIDFSYGPGEGVTGWVMSTRQPYFTNDSMRDPHLDPPAREKLKIRNIISVPIISISGELLGCFSLHNKRGNKLFDQEDVSILQGLAASAAIALENSRMLVEQKRTEEALHEAEAKYRSLIEESLVGVYLIVGDEFVYVNPRFVEMYGYSQEEAVGMKVVDVAAPEYRELMTENLRQRLSREVKSAHYTLKCKRKDGTIFDAEVYGSVTVYKGQTAIIGSVMDISERKKAEESLLLDEARLEALLRLSQMTDATLEEISDFALQEAINLTKSKIGYLAFANEDETVLNMFSWSKLAREMCIVSDKPTVYPVKETGLWGEAIRQRKPIITNDYVAPNPYKRGLPDGHIELIRHMNIPVFDGKKIVAVAGVGNKDEDYNESDVRQITLLMDGMHRLLQRKRTALELKESEENRRQFEKHVEAQKRQFYRETIISVTGGKLDICDAPFVRPYISKAVIKINVSNASQIGPARRRIERYCLEQGLTEDRLNSFVIAVGEAITNAIKHGKFGRVYAGTDNGAVWVGVSDRGEGIESLILPRATLLRGFSTKPSLGLGYSIMLDVCDRILLKTGDRGTTVILIKNLQEPQLAVTPDQLPDTWSSIP